ncbi:MAG: hypothetical protein COX90_04310 [Candidatus Nealsonbacteria bacterium CG_4_10_14_0_2_um_filter_38_17]|uniref:Uncharacterized protein n=2 Tax=Candidatus Nealsoniibacteriota TaxID=1817911 RepID=A0A2M7UX87_9BACT|nr:MAG: hypothetical protein COX36_01865 [Candidatus Nealsonbacteria bacterium CG23_combo_of_CG06-09_8_20_14_all_38_19]PIZ88485.1 MAG: hypothetical protein COX90_04310 [Candidatus Nealsonbacteria bacterium CG_4_10_14_0_2_um_filter_38_17]
MKIEHILGYVLIAAGLTVIFFVVLQSYNIFTGKALPPGIFKFQNSSPSPSPSPTGKTPTSPEDIQKQVETMIGEKIKEIIPMDIISKIFNLISWSILAGILIFAGTQVAGLGIKLVKE